MTRLHWLGAALVFLGSTAAGFALRQELISSVVCCRCRRRCAIWRRVRPSR